MSISACSYVTPPSFDNATTSSSTIATSTDTDNSSTGQASSQTPPAADGWSTMSKRSHDSVYEAATLPPVVSRQLSTPPHVSPAGEPSSSIQSPAKLASISPSGL